MLTFAGQIDHRYRDPATGRVLPDRESFYNPIQATGRRRSVHVQYSARTARHHGATRRVVFMMFLASLRCASWRFHAISLRMLVVGKGCTRR